VEARDIGARDALEGGASPDRRRVVRVARGEQRLREAIVGLRSGVLLALGDVGQEARPLGGDLVLGEVGLGHDEAQALEDEGQVAGQEPGGDVQAVEARPDDEGHAEVLEVECDPPGRKTPRAAIEYARGEAGHALEPRGIEGGAGRQREVDGNRPCRRVRSDDERQAVVEDDAACRDHARGHVGTAWPACGGMSPAHDADPAASGCRMPTVR
jgi:hypothetical protein